MSDPTISVILPEPRVLTGDNPFNVDPNDDFLAEPRHDIPLWSETMYFSVWSPENKVGLWLHVGLVPTDKTLWWAQTYAMLPEGVVLVDRSFGRVTDKTGPNTGNLRIECLEPQKRWRLSFDGAGEISSSADLGERVVGAGIARPFKFDVELEAVVPVYDMHAAMGRDMEWDVAQLHHEQGFVASGYLATDTDHWEIRGSAVRDHSRGERHFGKWGGHVWTYIVWPESRRAVAVFAMWSPKLEPMSSLAVVMEKGRAEISNDFCITGMSKPGGHPNDVLLRLERLDGSVIELKGEVQHTVTMTYVEPNHNLNGVYLDPREDIEATIADESIVRWEWADGEVGYSNFERGFRPSSLPLVDIPINPDSRFAKAGQ